MLPSQRGSIIAFTLIILSFILTSGLAVMTVASLERKSGLITQKSVTAFQAADSGAERLLRRIYHDNSPSTMTVPENDDMPDATLTQVAQGLVGVQSAACDSSTSQVVATSSSSPSYNFEASFWDGNGNQINCSDHDWRDKVVRMKVEGFYSQTARVIEMGIKPRPLCDPNDTVTDDDGNVYHVLQLGTRCWMQENMRIGTMVMAPYPASPPAVPVVQSNNGIIEKYCYANQAANCTANHPNFPDGGLYTWGEAMQYSADEGAQGICPANWHIPSQMEWYELFIYLDPTVTNPPGVSGTTIAFQLEPGGSSRFEKNFSGTHDAFSFGDRGTDPGGMASFHWSSTERPGAPSEAVFEGLIRAGGNTGQFIHQAYWLKNHAWSVRCVLDE